MTLTWAFLKGRSSQTSRTTQLERSSNVRRILTTLRRSVRSEVLIGKSYIDFIFIVIIYIILTKILIEITI